MFKTLSEAWKADPDLPARAHRLQMLHRVLDGTLYDVLQHSFDKEQNGLGEYIPLRHRRPSVQFNVARTAVGHAAAMLFSEGHFPSVKHEDRDTRAKLARLTKEASLNEVFREAVVKGAPGSCMVLVRVLSKRVFISAHASTYLTPSWDPAEPDKLLSVTEQYKVRGSALKDAGYTGDYADNQDYWLRTVWDRVAETTFYPEPVVRPKDEADKPIQWRADPDRTVAHNLGFVPAVWLKLLGGDSTDGETLLRPDAINTSIELDYLLSQNGRGLRYNLDPKLVVKEPAFQQNSFPVEGEAQAATPAGGGNVIKLATDGDAKLLEMTGNSTEAAISFAKFLRELALEALNGNRASAEKLATAQSGKAMELMNAPLVWLADDLRIVFGDKGLGKLYQMLIDISAKVPLKFENGEDVGELKKGNVTLVWPAWYSPTPDELQKKVQTLAEAVMKGLMSREAAIHRICELYDIEDVDAEIKLVEAQLAEMRKHEEAEKREASDAA